MMGGLAQRRSNGLGHEQEQIRVACLGGGWYTIQMNSKFAR